MNALLNNPVFAALHAGDAHLGTRSGGVAWFDAEVSPFVGIEEGYAEGFADLHRLLPAGRRILHATRHPMAIPEGWRLGAEVAGTQFVYDGPGVPGAPALAPQLLTPVHAAEMVALAALTRPGPFDRRTIEFGHYYGFFDNGILVAMTGQRLHPGGYAEVSAVCTHPDHLGKGYAAALIQWQLQLICREGLQPFLHVRSDNARAIALYERLHFRASGPMHFYFLQRSE